MKIHYSWYALQSSLYVLSDLHWRGGVAPPYSVGNYCLSAPLPTRPASFIASDTSSSRPEHMTMSSCGSASICASAVVEVGDEEKDRGSGERGSDQLFVHQHAFRRVQAQLLNLPTISESGRSMIEASVTALITVIVRDPHGNVVKERWCK